MPRSLPSPIVRILRQSRWSPADARLVLDAVADSGRSFLEFVREHQVDVQRLYAWRRRLASPPDDPAQAFVELRASEVALPPVSPARYEIQLLTGEILRVEGAVDPAAVAALLTVRRAIGARHSRRSHPRWRRCRPTRRSWTPPSGCSARCARRSRARSTRPWTTSGRRPKSGSGRLPPTPPASAP